jgi:putative ATP-binding cassette transporter
LHLTERGGGLHQIADWKATVDRLTGFRGVMMRMHEAIRNEAGIRTDSTAHDDVIAENVELRLPGGAPLVSAFSFDLKPGASTLITGASGSGKSTLFRALAGLWPFGSGRLRLPEGKRLLFLPQKPYLIIGTLRAQLCYPDAPDTYSDAELKRVLVECDLPQLTARLDEEQHWAQQLSGGEQQRIAFARALLQKPDWLFMDEASASMDEAAEAKLYGLLRTHLPQTTVISIGHRASLAQFHGKRLTLTREHGVGQLVGT